ncbi:MAG: hypothetical protein OES09_05020, partial [Gammaproteobacteria bacterium]|nr:hypothetical protein [Gammaproteobacteria bacterium]
MAAETDSFAVSKEMSISHHDFFRTLPRVLADTPYRIGETAVEVADGTRKLRITLAPETKRRMGAMQLPPP